MYDTITLPSQLCGFEQSDLPENANSFIQSIKGKHHFTICGCLPQMDLFDTRCCKCGREMHGHGYVTERLAHIPLCSEFIMERFDSQLNAMVPRPVRVYRTDVCVTVPLLQPGGAGQDTLQGAQPQDNPAVVRLRELAPDPGPHPDEGG